MMQFVVIGETISRLDESFKKYHSEIPRQKIKDFIKTFINGIEN